MSSPAPIEPGPSEPNSIETGTEAALPGTVGAAAPAARPGEAAVEAAEAAGASARTDVPEGWFPA